MAENQTPALEDAPRDLYPTSDLRFVLVEIGKLGAKVDRLVGDFEKMDSRIGGIAEKSDERLAGIFEKMEGRISGIAEKSDERIAGIVEKMDERISGIAEKSDERIAGMIEKNDERIRGIVEKTDERIGGLFEKIDERINRINADLAELKQDVSFVKGAVWAIGVLVVLVGIAVGWYITGKITITVHPGA